jgi:hypothetical protein
VKFKQLRRTIALKNINDPGRTIFAVVAAILFSIRILAALSLSPRLTQPAVQLGRRRATAAQNNPRVRQEIPSGIGSGGQSFSIRGTKPRVLVARRVPLEAD